MVKNIVIGVALVLSLVALFLPTDKSVQPVEYDGALNSPDLQIGGVRLTSAAMSPIQATSSIICSLQSPAATSSLIWASVGLNTATSAVTNLSINRSVQPYATTTGTNLALTQVASGATGGYIAMASNTPFFPNTYVVIGQTGGGILNQSGNCEALFAPIF